jgi:class 3 adenylate cyclase
VERTFVFTDIVGSTALLEVIGDEAWTALRRWHDEALRACFAAHGGEEIDHAGDGFFLTFPDASAAIACAVEIQQRLADHRRDHGFAPGVRIGIHADAATREGPAYSGKGVHQAARIAALADAGEILASVGTVEGVQGVATTAEREVDLKGFATPVRVATILWRTG